MKDKKNKENKIPRCPGCGKHCPMGNAKCKYGVKYFAKLQNTTVKTDKPEKARWEKHVTDGTWLHSLISVSRAIKKAVCKEKLTESAVINMLTAEEAAQLTLILNKLEKFKRDV